MDLIVERSSSRLQDTVPEKCSFLERPHLFTKARGDLLPWLSILHAHSKLSININMLKLIPLTVTRLAVSTQSRKKMGSIEPWDLPPFHHHKTLLPYKSAIFASPLAPNLMINCVCSVHPPMLRKISVFFWTEEGLTVLNNGLFGLIWIIYKGTCVV